MNKLMLTGFIMLTTTFVFVAIIATRSKNKINFKGFMIALFIFLTGVGFTVTGAVKDIQTAYNNGYNAGVDSIDIESIQTEAYNQAITDIIETITLEHVDALTGDIELDIHGELKHYTFEPNVVSLGEYELTAYCACLQCCGKTNGITATGTQAKSGRTIAVDPKDIPYGSHVLINGHEYIAEDCGGGIKNKRIDVYFDTHQEAINFGRQKGVEVYKIINL